MHLVGSAMSFALLAASTSTPITSLGSATSVSSLGAAPAPDLPAPAPTVTAQSVTAQSAGGQATQISVLTYNIHGLPWPFADRRGSALRAIGRDLAARRQAGQQPDVVLIQEGFRGEIADLVKLSGYRYWAQGPGRFEPPPERPSADAPAYHYHALRYPLSGEGWGKFTGSGLHVLSDLPILEVRSEAYRACAGIDCLANKGVMMARLALPNGAGEVDIVNTHMNAKRASRTPPARFLRAHNLQTEQLVSFIKREHEADIPLLVGGDFNVKGAPARYDYDEGARPYTVVSEFCDALTARCEGQAPDATVKPWLRSQDLQAFHPGGPVDVRPVGVTTILDARRGERALSDHAGYLVRYRLSWSSAALAQTPLPALELKPPLGRWDVKRSWHP